MVDGHMWMSQSQKERYLKMSFMLHIQLYKRHNLINGGLSKLRNVCHQYISIPLIFTYSVGASNHRWNKPNLTMRRKHMRHKRRHCNDISLSDADVMCDEYVGSALTTNENVWYDGVICMGVVYVRICSETTVKPQGMGCLADYIVRKEKSKKKAKKQVRFHLIKPINVIVCHILVAHNILQLCAIYNRRSSTIDKCSE
jgi:hypothetical protein